MTVERCDRHTSPFVLRIFFFGFLILLSITILFRHIENVIFIFIKLVIELLKLCMGNRTCTFSYRSLHWLIQINEMLLVWQFRDEIHNSALFH